MLFLFFSLSHPPSLSPVLGCENPPHPTMPPVMHYEQPLSLCCALGKPRAGEKPENIPSWGSEGLGPHEETPIPSP